MIWVPGLASSVRMRRAKTPPTTKKPIELIRYRIPIFLWSVVVSHDRTQPRGLGAIARGRASVTAIVRPPSRLLASSHDQHARHGRPVDVALEVVPAGLQVGYLEGLRGHAREAARLEVLLRLAEAVVDREVVVDAGVLVVHGERDAGLGWGRQAVGVPRDVLGGDGEGRAVRRAVDALDGLDLLLRPGGVIGRRHHLDHEGHPRVPQPAELGTLSR